MARSRALLIGALNFTIHPHTPALYLSLMKAVFENQRPSPIRGADWGMLGTLSRVPQVSNEQDGVCGEIYRFLNLNPEEPWLNMRTRAAVDQDTGAPQIPEHLKPNLRKIPYVFFPNGHRLFFDAKALSPRSAERLFRALLREEHIVNSCGETNVHTEVNRERLEAIMSLPFKQKILIDITLPNPDDTGEDERRVVERMQAQRLKRQKAELVAAGEEGIAPDTETNAMMRTARSQGSLRVLGTDNEQKKVDLSTTEYPFIQTERYSPDDHTILEKLFQAAVPILEKFRRGE